VVGHSADASLPSFRGSVAGGHMEGAFSRRSIPKFNIGFKDLATVVEAETAIHWSPISITYCEIF
jgi:hypothetical protein